MGIGITGISKAKLVPCSGEYVEGEYDVCLEEHITVDAPSGRRNGVKSGCYIVGRGGRTFDLDFGYAAYSGFVRRLSLMALGAQPEEVWSHPRRFRGKPFVELIGFPDTCGGAIGPVSSAKLYGEFVAFAPKAKRYFAAFTPNVFSPPQMKKRSERDPHRNRTGLSSVVELTQALGGNEIEWDEGENLDWMWESYRGFRRALRLARNGGLVVFY
jgi:hypothetical protein